MYECIKVICFRLDLVDKITAIQTKFRNITGSTAKKEATKYAIMRLMLLTVDRSKNQCCIITKAISCASAAASGKLVREHTLVPAMATATG